MKRRPKFVSLSCKTVSFISIATPVSTKMRKYTFDEVRAAVEAQNNYTVPLNENHTLHIHFKFAAEIPSLDQNEKRGLEVPSFSVVMELQTKNDQPESQIENSEEVLLQLIRDAATEFKNPKGFHQIEAPTNDRVAFESNFGNTYEAGISEGRLVIAVDNFVRAAAILTDLLPLMNSIVVQAVNKFRNDTTPKSTKEIVFSPPKIGERNAPLTAPQLTKSVKSQFSGE